MVRERREVATFGGRTAIAVGVLCALVGTVLALLYAVPELQPLSTFTAMASALIPYGVLAWGVAVLGIVIGGRGRQRWWLVPPLVMLLVQVGWARPYWPVAPPPSASEQSLRVFSANLHNGDADPAATAAAIRTAAPDVVILIEVDDAFLAAPAVRDALAAHTHRVGRSVSGDAPDPSTLVIASTRPLTQLGPLPGRFDQYLVGVAGHDGDRPWTLAAVHPINMLPGGRAWDDEAAALARALAPHRGGSLVVAGDFNATAEQQPMRRLWEAGLRNGAADAGAGWVPTYDAGLAPRVAFVAIDHAVTSPDLRATRFVTVALPGTDHRAISFTVQRA